MSISKAKPLLELLGSPIKETVERDAGIAFYMSPGSGNPSAVEFDIRS